MPDLTKTNRKRLSMVENGLGSRGGWQVEPDMMSFDRSVVCRLCGRQINHVFRIRNVIDGKSHFVGARCVVTVFAWISGGLARDGFKMLEELLNESEVQSSMEK